MSSTSNWGGKRLNAGRKREKVRLASDRTKVMRLPERHWVRVKNGSYDEIIHLLRETRQTMEESKQYRNSPRWAKLWEFMDGIEEILGSEWDCWED